MENSLVRPKVSFCIPTYNRDFIVKSCVEHILEYKGNDIEVVVSNNGSQDGTLEMLATIKDDRLHVRSNDKNLGFNKNVSDVLKMANGEFCFLLSDEDLISVDKIPELINFLTETKCVSAVSALGLHNIYSDEEDKLTVPTRDETPYFKGNLTESLKACSRAVYITGIIIKKDIIDFDKLDAITDAYPHIYLLFDSLKYGNMTATETEFALQNAVPRVTHTSKLGDKIDKDDYIHPIARYYQMVARFDWVDEDTEDEAVRIAVYRYLCIRHVRGIHFNLKAAFPSDYKTKIPMDEIGDRVVYYNNLTDEILGEVTSSKECRDKFQKLTREFVEEIIFDEEF